MVLPAVSAMVTWHVSTIEAFVSSNPYKRTICSIFHFDTSHCHESPSTTANVSCCHSTLHTCNTFVELHMTSEAGIAIDTLPESAGRTSLSVC